jgi:hypothetical protein
MAASGTGCCARLCPCLPSAAWLDHRTRPLVLSLMLQLRTTHCPHLMNAKWCAATITERQLHMPLLTLLIMTARPAGGDKQPEDFHYTHLWVDKAGETHLKECSMKGFDLKQYAKGERPALLLELH